MAAPRIPDMIFFKVVSSLDVLARTDLPTHRLRALGAPARKDRQADARWRSKNGFSFDKAASTYSGTQ